jgi:plastocyanin
MRRATAAVTAIVVAAGIGASAVPSMGASTRGVSVKDDKFVAKSVTLSKGASVRWVWKGHAPHNVTVVRGPKMFRAGTRTKGRFTHKFTARGTYKIICTIHAPDMKMTVTVK